MTIGDWLLAPVALGRIAALRMLSAAFVIADMWWLSPWVYEHGRVDADLYRPVALARILHVPAATAATMDLLRWGCLIGALVIAFSTVTAFDRLVRPAGVGLAVGYGWWMLLAMSYGKVDHDRLGFLVLLSVLPTVAGARLGDRSPSAAAGWAVRMTQIAAVATYALAGLAKIRFGGWAWANGATFARAIIRRGSSIADRLVDSTALLQISQWVMLVGELASPAILLVRRERVVWCIVACLYAFHAITFMTLGIAFFPHLVALAAFLPLERIGPRQAGEVPVSRSA